MLGKHIDLVKRRYLHVMMQKAFPNIFSLSCPPLLFLIFLLSFDVILKDKQLKIWKDQNIN